MPTIANMPAADIQVAFPSGETRNVNMIVLLVEKQNAEWHAKYGCAMPGVNKLSGITINKFREKYELDYFFDAPVRTWEDCAVVLNHLYTTFDAQVKAHIESLKDN